VGSEVGLTLDAHQLDDAFYSAWKKMPPRAAIVGPRENDDKDWTGAGPISFNPGSFRDRTGDATCRDIPRSE
jgi:hypothetical protein